MSVPIYGMERWGDLFSPRQALALTTLARLVREAGNASRDQPAADRGTSGGGDDRACAALSGSKPTSVTRFVVGSRIDECPAITLFGRQAIGMVLGFRGGQSYWCGAAATSTVHVGTCLTSAR